MKYIKNLSTFIALLVIAAACGKDEPATPSTPAAVSHNRDIFYTVSSESDFSGFSGNTVHLSTEEEWDALLDSFCTHAQLGERVSFRNTGSSASTKLKSSSKDTHASISTTSRTEIKRWMKEMEQAGKTVNVTFDERTGTWNGTAYDSLSPQDNSGTAASHDGTVIFLPPPQMGDFLMDGIVLALQESDNEVYIITIQGMMLLLDSDIPEETLALIQGYRASFTGVASTHYDINGVAFKTLDVEVDDDGILIF